MELTSTQRDRAAGVLLGLACGDALGAGYEFQPPVPYSRPIQMSGGGSFGWAPGQWTDDTDMALAIALTATAHAGLHTAAAQDELVRRWAQWADSASDVGVQTRAVLSAVRHAPTAESAVAAARHVHESNGQSAGNGSLMRTAPLALVYLDDPDKLWQVAQDVSALTHHDPAAGEACALWCMAIRHAVLEGNLDGMRDALHRLPADRRAHWEQRLDAAEAGRPWHFPNNGWVETAFQAAWCAVATTPEQPLHPEIHVFPAQTAAIAIERAVRAGHDTDTVAAIAGSLIGARWGMSALPARWLSVVHGWPGMRANDLQHLAQALVSVATDKAPVAEPIPASVSVSQWPNSGVRAEVPSQRGLTVAGQQGMRDVASREDPAGMRDAAGTRASAGTQVVSLSRVGSDETSLAHRHLPVFVLDQPGCNPNLHFSLVDVSETVAQWLDGGEVVLHCVQAENRTPAFAAAYLVSQLGLTPEQARAEVASVLPSAKFAAHLFDAVTDLPPRVTGDGPALGDELLRRGHDGAIYAVTPSVVLRRHHAAWTLHEGGADDSWTAATWADVEDFDETQRSRPAAV